MSDEHRLLLDSAFLAVSNDDAGTLMRMMRTEPGAAAVADLMHRQNLNGLNGVMLAVMQSCSGRAVMGDSRQMTRILVTWCQWEEDSSPLTMLGVDDCSALHLAVSYQNEGIIEDLLQFAAGEQLAVRGPEGLTPLMHAISKGYLAVAEQLLEYQPEVQVMTANAAGEIPLYVAASVNSSVAVFEALLEHSPEEQLLLRCGGLTALHQAVILQHGRAVAALVEAAREVGCLEELVLLPNQSGNIPLMTAACYPSPKIARLLLQYTDSQVLVKGEREQIALHFAAQHGNRRTAVTLLAHHTEQQLLAVDADGFTSLMVSSGLGTTALNASRKAFHMRFVCMLLWWDPRADQLYGVEDVVLQQVIRKQKQGRKYKLPFCGGSCSWCEAVEGEAVERAWVLPRCEGCCLVEYCSRKCQKAHWVAAKRPHKLLCERVQMLVA